MMYTSYKLIRTNSEKRSIKQIICWWGNYFPRLLETCGAMEHFPRIVLVYVLVLFPRAVLRLVFPSLNESSHSHYHLTVFREVRPFHVFVAASVIGTGHRLAAPGRLKKHVDSRAGVGVSARRVADRVLEQGGSDGAFEGLFGLSRLIRHFLDIVVAIVTAVTRRRGVFFAELFFYSPQGLVFVVVVHSTGVVFRHQRPYRGLVVLQLFLPTALLARRRRRRRFMLDPRLDRLHGPDKRSYPTLSHSVFPCHIIHTLPHLRYHRVFPQDRLDGPPLLKVVCEGEYVCLDRIYARWVVTAVCYYAKCCAGCRCRGGSTDVSAAVSAHCGGFD
mmetsp:Transcript_40137/g.78421  ORF Transcript_40137/g.78421 Transcript_40137/m.78421 type:complete len:331 (-) Transcript_40137:29-1021(-)